MKKLLAVALCCWGILSSCGKPETTGKITLLAGEVTVGGTPAKVDDILKADSVIRTGANSFCEIQYGNKNIFRIMDNTEVSINLLTRNKKIRVSSGKIAYALLNPLGKNKQDTFEVETEVATAAVRGTVFFVKVFDKDKAYYCACNGTIGINSSELAGDNSLSSAHHIGAYVERGDDGLLVITPGSMDNMEDHDDHLMESVASNAHLGIDWNQLGGLHVLR